MRFDEMDIWERIGTAGDMAVEVNSHHVQLMFAIRPDEMVFSPTRARGLAALLNAAATESERKARRKAKKK